MDEEALDDAKLECHMTREEDMRGGLDDDDLHPYFDECEVHNPALAG